MRTLRRLLTQTWRAVRIPLLVAGLIDTLSEIDCNFDGVPGYTLYLVPHNAPGSHDSYTRAARISRFRAADPTWGCWYFNPLGTQAMDLS
jgi:hypothetical protein